MDEASISERLEEAARMVRSPLSHDADGELTATGLAAYSSLDAIVRELPSIPAKSIADALALVVLSHRALDVLVQRAKGDSAAAEAAAALADALGKLRTCLSGLTDRKADDMDFMLDGRPVTH